MRRFIGFSRVAAWLMVAIALAALLGWWFDVPLMTTLLPGQRSMQANAAIGFAASGCALLLPQRSAWQRRLSLLLSLLVLAIGAATLVEHIWAVDLGIDHLVDSPLSHPSGLSPRRTAALADAALVLLGGLGLLVVWQRWLYLRELLALALLGIAMTGLGTYGLALAGSSNVGFEQVPLHTMLLILLATLAWLSSVPATGLTRLATASTQGGMIARRLLLPSLLLPVAFTFLFEVLQGRMALGTTLASALLASFTGGSIAWLVWTVAALLDKMERQRLEVDALRDDANTDALTHLANRRAFDRALARLIRGQREGDITFSLLMLDLDKFKTYNDTFGHAAGDEVLRITGQILHSVLRPSDLAARYGGEEFAVLLHASDAHQAGDVATRILAAFRAFHWPQRAVTISVGVAQAAADDSALGLIERADTALYTAKNTGRDKVVVAPVPGPSATTMATARS